MFNDTNGHLAGDQLLRKMAAVMRATIRTSDRAFRYGGDEFAILLPETSIDAACQVAGRVLVEAPRCLKMATTTITVSLGVACWPADGISPTEIFAAADSALYEAKRRGGNQYVRTYGGVLPVSKAASSSVNA